MTASLSKAADTRAGEPGGKREVSPPLSSCSVFVGLFACSLVVYVPSTQLGRSEPGSQALPLGLLCRRSKALGHGDYS